MFPCSAFSLSTDDMVKIKVVLPAVSRYHKFCQMFMKDDNMNLPDRDFPIPFPIVWDICGFKITLRIKLLSTTFSHHHHSTLQMAMISSPINGSVTWYHQSLYLSKRSLSCNWEAICTFAPLLITFLNIFMKRLRTFQTLTTHIIKDQKRSLINSSQHQI